MALTDGAIRNAKPRTKAFKLYGRGGLHLEVSPSGGKWWRLKYRFNGEENRISPGVYLEVSFGSFPKDEYQAWSGERRVLEQVADVGAQAFGRG